VLMTTTTTEENGREMKGGKGSREGARDRGRRTPGKKPNPGLLQLTITSDYYYHCSYYYYNNYN